MCKPYTVQSPPGRNVSQLLSKVMRLTHFTEKVRYRKDHNVCKNLRLCQPRTLHKARRYNVPQSQIHRGQISRSKGR
jgi:hypothetical protein